ncbi:DUF1365 family protein [Alsobacter sp. SYSU M60028]|uniref:DUF1365 family protein n=1 Tax=Alsobacter ponti TaxID=2962936 RepID=A0ABT1LEB2_9HYPH|nr:DUF1365 family protein [Alsobacter ponti]MCP8939433.1 DUF1365 family protein [Alsobacter ponti]
MIEASALYVGHVMHRRTRPRAHRLNYRLVSLLLDLDEIDELGATSWLFSRNAFNVFSFRDRDYGAGTAEPLRAQMERLCASAGVNLDGGAIRLLTIPRILGFAFNPLSVFYCHDSGGALRAIVYEVNNTFGERHSYVIPVEGGGHGEIRQSCAKDFHVSPFMPMDMRYAFRVAPPGERLTLAITVSDKAGPVLAAVHTARRRRLSDAALARLFFSNPVSSVKVVAGILYEALRLWLKRVPVYPHPAPPAEPVTIAGMAGETARP